jgi:hypothetical protein
MRNCGAVSVHLILRVQKVSKIYSGSSADLRLRGGLVWSGVAGDPDSPD